MMNMQKLGTVSLFGNDFKNLNKPRKQRAGGLLNYTLCEHQNPPRRYGSRYGCAFYRIPVLGNALFSVWRIK